MKRAPTPSRWRIRKLLLLDLISHEKHEVDLSKSPPGIMEDPLKELREKAEKKKKDSKDKKDGKEERDKKEKTTRESVAGGGLGLACSDDGHYAGLMLRASDNKDRWIVTLSASRPAAGLPPPLDRSGLDQVGLQRPRLAA